MSMLPKQNQPWYQNVFGTGSNVFGASSNTDALYNAGLLSEEDIAKANRKSIMQGLLGTAISYISQPKNQGYGSALPYLGKAFMTGMESAQKPFDSLTEQANMKMKMGDYKYQQTQRQRQDEEYRRKEEARQFREAILSTRVNEKGETEIYVDEDKLLEMKYKYPEQYKLYVDNQKTEMEANKLENEAKGGSLMDIFSKVGQDKFTQRSVAEYIATGDRRKLVPLDEYKNDLEVRKLIAEAKYEYGIDITDGNASSGGSHTQGKASGEVPNQLANKKPGENMSTVTLPYNGDEVIPEIYRSDLPLRRKHELEAKQKDERRKLKAGASYLREERKLIHKVLNAGNLHKVSGWQSYFKNWRGGEAADTDALLYAIQQKEFLNNYLQIKASGGGFGALSEKEGERLERIRANLQQEQNPKQLAEILMELDDILAKEELSLYEDYMSVYGEYDYRPIELPGYADSIYAKNRSTADSSSGAVPGVNLRVGEIKKGHRYLGGDVNNPANWEKVE